MHISPRSTIVGLSIYLISSASFAATHWEYKGHHGAQHWSELDATYEQCAIGQKQSPVDIRKTEKADLPALNFHYSTSTPVFWNNGHTIQVNLPPGNTLEVGGKNYQLLQFHFHLPSEEAINGKRFPMVAHFVHKNDSGQLGVIGVLMKQGKANETISAVFSHLPHPGEKITVDDLTLDVSSLMPKSLAYYSFEGSLTTPPCSEGVNWMVLKEPISLSAKQIAAFKKLIGSNARPVQPLNGRIVQESQ